MKGSESVLSEPGIGTRGSMPSVPLCSGKRRSLASDKELEIWKEFRFVAGERQTGFGRPIFLPIHTNVLR